MRAVTTTELVWGKLRMDIQLCKATTDVDVKFEKAFKKGDKYSRKPFETVEDTVNSEEETNVFAEKAEPEEEVVKGRWISDDTFVEIPAEKLSEIDDRTKPTEANIVGFMKYGEIPFERVESSYYVQPKKGSDMQALRVLHAAAMKLNRVAIVEFGVRTRQRVGFMQFRKDCIILSSASFAEEWREPDHEVVAHLDLKLGEGELKLAQKLVGEQTIDREGIDSIVDERLQLRRDLIAEFVETGTLPNAEVSESPFAKRKDVKALLEESLQE